LPGNQIAELYVEFRNRAVTQDLVLKTLIKLFEAVSGDGKTVADNGLGRWVTW
jgi:hypothetical protein